MYYSEWSVLSNDFFFVVCCHLVCVIRPVLWSIHLLLVPAPWFASSCTLNFVCGLGCCCLFFDATKLDSAWVAPTSKLGSCCWLGGVGNSFALQGWCVVFLPAAAGCWCWTMWGSPDHLIVGVCMLTRDATAASLSRERCHRQPGKLLPF